MKKYTKEQIQEAMTHLTNAHEIMTDPELMKAVKTKMKGLGKIKSIADIREAASESQKEEDTESESFEKMEDESKEKHSFKPFGKSKK